MLWFKSTRIAPTVLWLAIVTSCPIQAHGQCYLGSLTDDTTYSDNGTTGGVAMRSGTIVLGAPKDDDKGNASGSAVFFRVVGGAWSFDGKVTASDGVAFDQFGNSVALACGQTLIGAPYRDDAGSNSGKVYVFSRSANGWSAQQTLQPTDARTNAYFGWALAADDDVVVIGSPGGDEGGEIGQAYVFRWNGTAWMQEAILSPSDGQVDDRFAQSLAIDDGTIVVGSRWTDSGAGAAYIFRRVGSSWVERAKLTATDGVPGDEFGIRVAAWRERVLIGAFRASSSLGAHTGAAYVFRCEADTWIQEAKLVARDAVPDMNLGYGTVSLSGERALVPSSHAGVVYVFRRSGTAWTQESRLPITGNGIGFGGAIDGSLGVVKAEMALGPSGGTQATAYLFDLAECPCRADFNRSGSTSVQDLFDFLKAYFAGCP